MRSLGGTLLFSAHQVQVVMSSVNESLGENGKARPAGVDNSSFVQAVSF